MPPVFMEIILLTLAGVFGALATGAALREYDLGKLGNILTGAIGGGIGGWVLMAIIQPMVTASGETMVESSPVNHAMILGVVGLVCGGLLTLVTGFVRNERKKLS
jgi:hypothetical protein